MYPVIEAYAVKYDVVASVRLLFIQCMGPEQLMLSEYHLGQCLIIRNGQGVPGHFHGFDPENKYLCLTAGGGISTTPSA